jgi:DNA-binding SARP family transcriptional activator/TolB-like protein/Tfp pilus assembly protein PilF
MTAIATLLDASAAAERDRGDAPRLFISVFGGVDITVDRREVRLSNRKARALLAYLALTESGRERRERLAGLLWPDTNEHNARASLRQVVLDIREALGAFGCRAVVAGRYEIELQGESIELDVSVMLREIASGRAPEGLLLHSQAGQAVLAGYDDLSPIFQDWILVSRAQIQARLVHALEQSYEDHTFSRRQRRRLAETALLLDPLHEAACRALMRLAAEDGEIGPALRAYGDLYNALGDQLDMEPSAATRELVAEIKQGLFDAARPLQPPRSSDTPIEMVPPMALHGGAPVVAILPFRPVGPDHVPSYFAEGLLEDTVRILAGLREPVVISSNSTRQFHHDVDLQQIGRSLGAGYVVTGTVRIAGERVRLAVELAEVTRGTVLWANAYDVPTPRFFEAQDNIASSIARTLVPKLQDAELRRSRGQRTEDLAAYQLMLQARELVFRLERPAFEQAGGLLREALNRAPGYALLHTAAADWYSLRIGQGWSSDPDADMRSLAEMAHRAIRMDSANGRALAMLAHNRTIFRREYREAIDLLDRALQASPNDAEALMWSSPTHAYIGDAGEAVRRAEQAIALSPQDPFLFRYQHFLCIAHYAAGAYEEAADWGLRSARANLHYTSNLRMTAAALAGLGRAAEARPLTVKVIELEPNFRVSTLISRQAFSDDTARDRYGRHLVEAGLPP